MQFMLPSDYQLHYKPSPVRHILPRHQAAAMMDVVMEGLQDGHSRIMLQRRLRLMILLKGV